MGVALTMALAFTSCKSSESAYKKAYEKAQQAQQSQQTTEPAQTTTVEVAPVTTTPTTTVNTTPANNTDYSNLNVKTENVTLISGDPLKSYSVVVGSFSVKANAEGLRTKLANAGMSPRIVKALVNGSDWYRVIGGSFNTKQEAGSFKASQQSAYPDAWLLYSK